MGEALSYKLILTRKQRPHRHSETTSPSALIKEGLLEITVPDKPRSSKQKYRLTAKGRARLAAHDSKQQEKGKDTP
jgi:hypothetical protein